MKFYSLFALLLCLSCNNSKPVKEEKPKPNPTLKGVYRLVALQEQDDTVFAPMEGVDILKIFTDSQWISPAWLIKNKKVVNLAGGSYTFSNGVLTETLRYHSKDTVNIGLPTMYKITFRNDTLYQSGIFKPDTPEEWKVEEYWVRVE